MRTLKNIFTTLLILLSVCLIGQINVYAWHYDPSDGGIVFDWDDSYGGIAADFNMNYYNLGFYNGENPDEVICYPGKKIFIGQTSGQEYFYGNTDTTHYWSDPSYQPVSTYNYTEPTYNYDYSYTPPVENYTNCYDEYGNYVYYNPNYNVVNENNNHTYDINGTVYEDTSSHYNDYTVTNNVYGSSYVALGYGGGSATNAARAAELNNNIIIPAGGIYSASSYLGDGGYGMGFVDATCLDGMGGTFQAPGGGICGITTTIHMAGKNTEGMTILQANPHNNGDGTTGVSYASPEDQASFSAGSSDLVMRNDTGHDLILNCSYVNGGATASFSSIN